MTALLVAAGGGGDALAAAIIHRATSSEPAVIATYAWDRLSIDPLPGPRGHANFVDLVALGPATYAVQATSRARPPAGSTLPRLASALRAPIVLLDPGAGAKGLQQQLEVVMSHHDVERLVVIDVGGDVLAHGNEPGLRSPLADALALAACSRVDAPSRLLVAGPGLDGELSEAEVLAGLGGELVIDLSGPDIAPFRDALDWHPSEATALLAAAAIGLRGSVEVRDAGTLVDLTHHSSHVYELSLSAALTRNRLSRALVDSSSFTEADTITRELLGFSEIEHEEAKATRLAGKALRLPTADDLLAVHAAEQRAARRGATYLTFRRLAEAATGGTVPVADLRSFLIAERPERVDWPLWSLAA